MTTTSQTWTEEMVQAAGARIQLVKGGSGEPLLILHDELGHPGWMRFHDALAAEHTLYIPSHPGFGKSERLDWIMAMRDMAGWYLAALDDLELSPVNAVGFSLGGWLAAEMATMRPHAFKRLVLVAPAGIKPPVGEIYDMFLAVSQQYIKDGVHDPDNVEELARLCPEEPSDEQIEAWEDAREQSSRLAWKPYMHYPGLPHLLRGVRDLPTLILWGRNDPIVPVSAGQVYNESIEGSRLVVLDDCGHRPEIERPDDFVREVVRFLAE